MNTGNRPGNSAVAGRSLVPKPLRLLQVEDDEGHAALLVKHLRRGGFEPAAQRVQSLDALRRALSSQAWDLIICDYFLPGCTALEALAVVRDSGADTPILVVSGHVGEETAIAAMRAGAADFLLKDNLARLVPTVERE